MAKERQKDIDIAKGILIIFVVLGHSDFFLKDYIYWFHMPAFFLISGFFFKETESYKQWKTLFKKQFKRMMIPYFSFLFTFCIFSLYPFMLDFNFERITEKLFPLLIGGRAMGGIYGAFWFMTVLFLSKLFIGVLDVTIRKEYLKYTISFVCLVLAYLESNFFNHIPVVFWNSDVVFIAQFFLLAGRKLKRLNFSHYLNLKTVLLFAFIFALFIFLDLIGIIEHSFDMKYVKYGNVFLSISLPLISLGIILNLSSFFERKEYLMANWIAYIGKGSMIIMFMHFAVNQFLENLGVPAQMMKNSIVFTCLGVIIPLLFFSIFKSIKVFRSLFLGEK